MLHLSEDVHFNSNHISSQIVEETRILWTHQVGLVNVSQVLASFSWRSHYNIGSCDTQKIGVFRKKKNACLSPDHLFLPPSPALGIGYFVEAWREFLCVYIYMYLCLTNPVFSQAGGETVIASVELGWLLPYCLQNHFRTNFSGLSVYIWDLYLPHVDVQLDLYNWICPSSPPQSKQRLLIF